MIIRKIRMVNFRAFHDKTIDFNDKPVVLLAAANGIGKTTTVDAIEWCLTGNIGRLKSAFDTRSTNDIERKMNTDGILKYRDAEKKEEVKVVLWLDDKEREIILCREQEKDELNPELSRVTINGSEEEAKAFILEYVGDSFYNFHFCDVQKSFNIQSKKRKDLNSFFEEFITNYDEQRQVADNLDVFGADVERYIEDKEKQKISQEVIESQEKELAQASEDAKQILYPKIMFYPEEKTEIVGMDRKDLIKQRGEVKKCGFQKAEEILFKLVENEELKNQLSIVKKIDFYWKTKRESIEHAIEIGLPQNIDVIIKREINLRKIKDLSLSRNTIFLDGKSVIDLKNSDFTKQNFEADKKKIEEKENEVKELSDEIELLSKNNELLKLLSALYAKRQVVIEYRNNALKNNDIVRCPVCGSESFTTIQENLILKEADSYIRKNGEAVRAKEMEKAELQKEIDAIYQRVINCAKAVVEKEKRVLETEIEELKDLKDQVQPYFEEVKKLQDLGKIVNIEDLTTKKIEELLNVINATLLDSSQEQEERENYQKILTVLGYTYKNETVQQTYAKVKSLIVKSYEVSEFSYDIFVTKLNAIDSILANKTLSDIRQKLEKYSEKNQKLDIEIKELQNLKNIADQRAKNIRDIVERLSKDEYEKVGPILNKFYNKLVRFNSSSGINIVQEKEGISLVDNKRKNIVNILSNGQISVFMLAYFFAGINARNGHERMKIYFVDDLTACMDDVNMLAFMDLLKYQLSSKATIDQLFFITCDERISKLLKYKLDGREIEVCELLEEDFV